jgi:8-oxo-dGTP pyrophosphatase MutT (NUDIX family)
VSVAGHVDPGETDETATLRELREEISLRVARERLQRVELLKALAQPQAARAPA